MITSEKTIHEILLKAFDNTKIKKDLFVKGLVSSLKSGYKLEYLLYLLFTDEPDIFYPNDYFKTKPDKYQLGKLFNYDDLIDLGLLSDDYMTYGQIIKDDGYSSDYDPFYGRVKVNMFYYDDEKNLLKKECSLSTHDLIKINKEDILHFKNLKNGKNQ